MPSQCFENMIEVEKAVDLSSWIDREIGVSDWYAVSQDQINLFAKLTGDDFWIHIDVKRAKTDMPDGKTIAHGFFTLALIPFLSRSIYRIRQRSGGLNYGSNRIRYTGQVQVGSRIRLRQTIKAVETVEGGVRVTTNNLVEIENQDRPALVAETLMLVYD